MRRGIHASFFALLALGAPGAATDDLSFFSLTTRAATMTSLLPDGSCPHGSAPERVIMTASSGPNREFFDGAVWERRPPGMTSGHLSAPSSYFQYWGGGSRSDLVSNRLFYSQQDSNSSATWNVLKRQVGTASWNSDGALVVHAFDRDGNSTRSNSTPVGSSGWVETLSTPGTDWQPVDISIACHWPCLSEFSALNQSCFQVFDSAGLYYDEGSNRRRLRRGSSSRSSRFRRTTHGRTGRNRNQDDEKPIPDYPDLCKSQCKSDVEKVRRTCDASHASESSYNLFADTVLSLYCTPCGQALWEFELDCYSSGELKYNESLRCTRVCAHRLSELKRHCDASVETQAQYFHWATQDSKELDHCSWGTNQDSGGVIFWVIVLILGGIGAAWWYYRKRRVQKGFPREQPGVQLSDEGTPSADKSTGQVVTVVTAQVVTVVPSKGEAQVVAVVPSNNFNRL